jgi:predicted lipid-binding transport protein (Tim44 family)
MLRSLGAQVSLRATVVASQASPWTCQIYSARHDVAGTLQHHIAQLFATTFWNARLLSTSNSCSSNDEARKQPELHAEFQKLEGQKQQQQQQNEQTAAAKEQQSETSSCQHEKVHNPPCSEVHDDSTDNNCRSDKSTASGGNSSNNNDNSSSSTQGRHENGDGDFESTEVLLQFRAETPDWYSRALQWMVHNHLDHPQLSTWSYLYQKPRSWLANIIWPKGSSMLTRLLKLEYAGPSVVAAPLLEEAEEDFEVEGFKDGVRQALSVMMSLYAQSDWEQLKPMVSAGLLQSMKDAYKEQQQVAESYGLSVQNVQLEVQEVQLVAAHAMLQHQLAHVDSHRAAQQLPQGDGAAPAWDCAHVYAEATMHASVVTSAAAKEISVPKSGHVVFCRGPLPADKRLPADADVPWFVLAWL